MAENGSESGVEFKAVDFDTLGDDSIEKQILNHIWEKLGELYPNVNDENLYRKTLGILTAKVKKNGRTATIRCVALPGFAYGDTTVQIPSDFLTKIERDFDLKSKLRIVNDILFCAPFEKERSFYVNIGGDNKTFAQDITDRFKNRIEKFRISTKFKACKGSEEKEKKVIHEVVKNSSHETQIWNDFKILTEVQRQQLLSEIVTTYFLCLKSGGAAIDTMFNTIQTLINKKKVLMDEISKEIFTQIEPLRDPSLPTVEVHERVLQLINNWARNDNKIPSKIAEYVGALQICTRMADNFSQCAEDNAVEAMAEKVRGLEESWTSISLSWTAISIDKYNHVQNKKLCAFCSLSFEERVRLVFHDILMNQQIEIDTFFFGCYQKLFTR